MYNTATLATAVCVCAVTLALGLAGREVTSLYRIPSRSMEPAVRVGDVLLVEKVTSRLGRAPSRGEVVLFRPPAALRAVVAAAGGRLGDRDLFVKRVAAGPGDAVAVTPAGDVTVNGRAPARPPAGDPSCREDAAPPPAAGKAWAAAGGEGAGGEGGPKGATRIGELVRAGEGVVERGKVFVLGDCAAVSVDSRVWGPLPVEEVVGRPVMRIWPPDRAGPVQ